MLQKHHERVFERENLIFNKQKWVGKGKGMVGGFRVLERHRVEECLKVRV
jgi:hypothetical protein